MVFTKQESNSVLIVLVFNCPQVTEIEIETELFGIVVAAVTGAVAVAREIVHGALKAIEGIAAETRTAIGAVVMTGTAGRGGEGRRDGEEWISSAQIVYLTMT